MANTRQRSWNPHVVAALLLASTGASLVPAEDLTASSHRTEQRVELTAGQARAIALLQQNRPQKPAPLFLFTDPNKDPDDLNVLVVTKSLQEHGFVDLRCVVTTLGNQNTRLKRAQFAAAVLQRLGLPGVSVGVGADYDIEVKDAAGNVDANATAGRKKDHQVFLETPLVDTRAHVSMDGVAMLRQELSQVPDHSAVLLINCGMVDAAALLRDAPELVKQKTAIVAIMGGVEKSPDDRGFVVADRRAYNNTTHQASADQTYLLVQELGLPLVVVTREAAYAAAVPRSFYDGMAATNHPVGVYLRDQQYDSLHSLWNGIHEGELPAALTHEWFFKTFTDVDADSDTGKAAVTYARTNADDFEQIWQQVSRFNLYDPLTLLAATPGAAPLLMQAEAPAGVQSNVVVISANSIQDSALVKELLTGLAVESLNPPTPKKSRTGTAPGYPPRQHVQEEDAAWTKPFENYQPLEYTAEVVLQHEGDWADPKDVRDVQRSFLTGTENGEVAVQLDESGRPLNPLGRTGLKGRGLLGRWGRNQAGDPLLTRVHPETGRLQILVIERKDSGQKALPGGMVDEGEEIAATVARELLEETGAKLNFQNATIVFSGVVDDPRNTDNAWMESTVLHKHLTAEEQSMLTLRAGDDAQAVGWIDLNRELLSSMYASHGDYVRLALPGLKTIPAVAEQVKELLK